MKFINSEITLTISELIFYLILYFASGYMFCEIIERVL